MKKTRSKRGFTIIEVVMVLAIGGLIFAVVFAAFPRVQKARRDGQRKSDLVAFAGELEAFQSSNRGRYPDSQAEANSLISSLSIDFDDPTTKSPYALTYTLSVPTATGSISYKDGAECSSDNTRIVNSGFNRTYGLVVKLEEGFHCVDT